MPAWPDRRMATAARGGPRRRAPSRRLSAVRHTAGTKVTSCAQTILSDRLGLFRGNRSLPFRVSSSYEAPWQAGRGFGVGRARGGRSVILIPPRREKDLAVSHAVGMKVISL